MNNMDIERQYFAPEFFNTHIVEKKDDLNLVFKAETPPAAWKAANVGRLVSWYYGDNSSVDAINQVFVRHLQSILGETFRHHPEDLENLQNRLMNLIKNAQSYEQHKTELFQNAYTSAYGLADLKPYIEQAKARQAEIEKLIASSAIKAPSPREEQLKRLNQNLMAGFQILLDKPVEGLFRIEGNQAMLKELSRAMQEATPEELAQRIAKEDPYNIAKAMARAVRELKPPLIGEDIYPFFLAVEQSAEKEKILAKAIGMLPEANCTVLLTILKSLKQLSTREQATKMGINNLAICWAPNLLISPQDKALADFAAVNSITKKMIEITN